MKRLFLLFSVLTVIAAKASSDVQLIGTWGYSIIDGKVRVTGDRIENFSDNGRTGTLQIKLFLTETKYSGGGISGYVALGSQFDPLVAGAYHYGIDVTQNLPNTIPSGTYYVTLVLLNYIDGEYLVTDHVNFENMITLSYSEPEPATPASTTMTIRVTNRNVSSGDVPGISTSADGANYVTVPLNSSVEFTVDISNPYLYLWTCDGPCIWKAFRVPTNLNGYFDYDVSDPMKRNLTFTRVE